MSNPAGGGSSDYRIFETDEFRKQLQTVPRSRRDMVSRKLSEYVYPQLRQSPHYGPNIKKLRGYTPDTWRYRIGPYRLFYLINETDRVVAMLTIDDRKDAYR